MVAERKNLSLGDKFNLTMQKILSESQRDLSPFLYAPLGSVVLTNKIIFMEAFKVEIRSPGDLEKNLNLAFGAFKSQLLPPDVDRLGKNIELLRRWGENLISFNTVAPSGPNEPVIIDSATQEIILSEIASIVARSESYKNYLSKLNVRFAELPAHTRDKDGKYKIPPHLPLQLSQLEMNEHRTRINLPQFLTFLSDEAPKKVFDLSDRLKPNHPFVLSNLSIYFSAVLAARHDWHTNPLMGYGLGGKSDNQLRETWQKGYDTYRTYLLKWDVTTRKYVVRTYMGYIAMTAWTIPIEPTDLKNALNLCQQIVNIIYANKKYDNYIKELQTNFGDPRRPAGFVVPDAWRPPQPSPMVVPPPMVAPPLVVGPPVAPAPLGVGVPPPSPIGMQPPPMVASYSPVVRYPPYMFDSDLRNRIIAALNPTIDYSPILFPPQKGSQTIANTVVVDDKAIYDYVCEKCEALSSLGRVENLTTFDTTVRDIWNECFNEYKGVLLKVAQDQRIWFLTNIGNVRPSAIFSISPPYLDNDRVKSFCSYFGDQMMKCENFSAYLEFKNDLFWGVYQPK